ncbi:uncharacterized protein [Venturia canescens]|uniref:uncharacterized protein n=1 Tax=Venturia canescens TaxID=32260 RepID=UPI001C9D0B99|nr:uncharacterized protein LOC122416596 [Venturia canescens]
MNESVWLHFRRGVLLFVWIVFVVGSKFRLLNERIKKCTNSSKVSSLRRSGNEAYLEIGENSSHSPLNEIATISRLHRELRNAIHLIEEYFASIILLNSLKQLLTATTCIHIFYRQLKIREQFTVDALVYTVHMSAWWIYPVTMLFVLSNVCGSTTEEANATGNLLHATLVNCRIDSHKIPEFDIFVLELLQNRVTISLLGFVEANYVLVYSMIVTSAGYLTIMLQFYD